MAGTRPPCRLKAATWLAAPLLLALCAIHAEGALSDDLLTISQSFQNFAQQGPWQGWAQGSTLPACNWTGVYCNATQGTFQLALPNRNLTGTLGAGWSALPSAQNLSSLYLPYNLLTGTLPPSFQAFGRLQALGLNHNSLNGTLPVRWGLNQAFGNALQMLNVSENKLRGTLPDWGSDGSLPQLYQLYLHNNSIAGTVPLAWQNGTWLPGMTSILASFVALPGNPQLCQIGANLGALTTHIVASIGNNTISQAPLPSCGLQSDGALLLNFSRSFTNFLGGSRAAYLGWTQNTTNIPCAWTGIQCSSQAAGPFSINLPSQGLNGTIDASWAALGGRVANMELDHNKIQGSLPADWGLAFSNLSFLSMGDNLIQSTLPAEWGNTGTWQSLDQLWLWQNPGITGSLPSAWGIAGGFSYMAYGDDDSAIGLHSCSLTGALPASWASRFNKLAMLELYNNKLQGTLPEEWRTMQPTLIDLHGNQLQGSLPFSWGNNSMQRLIELDLSQNAFTGTVPAWGLNSGMANLTYLNISLNTQLRGSVPATFSSLKDLQALDVSSNPSLCGAVNVTSQAEVIPSTTLGTCPVAAAPPSVPATPPAKAGSSSSVGPIVGGVVGGLVALALVALLAVLLVRRRKQKADPAPQGAMRSHRISSAQVPLTGMMPDSSSSGDSRLAKTAPSSMAGSATTLPSHPSTEWEWQIEPHRLQPVLLPNGQRKTLGRGAFGEVYMARLDDSLPVAVKVMSSSSISQEDVQAFAQEINVLRRIRHPNVVLLMGACMQEGSVYMVQELMHTDLWTALADDRLQSTLHWYNRGQHLALDIAYGVAHLHQPTPEVVIHFDIKSPNCLLAEGLGRAKIADAGLARALQGQDHLSEVSMRGTWSWMSPELLLQNGPIGTACDIYSLGMVMWEIATQERPSRGKNREIQCPEDCPTAVADLIYACLDSQPSARPTAKDVVHALQHQCRSQGDRPPGGPPPA